MSIYSQVITNVYKSVYTPLDMGEIQKLVSTALIDDALQPESGKEIRLEMYKSEYCSKCQKLIRIVDGEFYDEKGLYYKGVCETCDETKKIRELKKWVYLDEEKI